MADLITTEEAAKILGVIPRRVRVLIASGRLPAQTFGAGNRKVHLIERADLRLVMERKTGRPPKKPEPRKRKPKEKP